MPKIAPVRRENKLQTSQQLVRSNGNPMFSN